MKEQKAVESYRLGKISADKATEIAGITLTEMMSLLSHAGIKSEQTFSEYSKGLQLLLRK